MHGGRVSEWRLSEATICPKLEPIEILRAHFYVVLVAMVLKEEHLVAPQRGYSLRSRDEPADEPLLAAVLRRSVEGEDLEHGSVGRNSGQLIKEVILELIRPPINIIRFDFDLEGPVVFLDFITILVEL